MFNVGDWSSRSSAFTHIATLLASFLTNTLLTTQKATYSFYAGPCFWHADSTFDILVLKGPE